MTWESALAPRVGSDIEAASRRASMLAIREFINREKKDLTKFKISARHFNGALKTMGRANEQP